MMASFQQVIKTNSDLVLENLTAKYGLDRQQVVDACVEAEIELWAAVKELKKTHQVSTFGRVRSLDRLVPWRAGRWQTQRGKLLKPSLNHKGYLRVTTMYCGQRYIFRVHRLVAKAFIPNPKGKPYVNHINAVKHDNHINNLEWVTQYENYLHAVSMNLTLPPKSHRRQI